MRPASWLVCLLLVGLVVTGCTPTPATPSRHSLFDKGHYNSALRAVVRKGMVVKIKHVRVTDNELVVTDEGDMRLTWRDGQVTGPEKTTGNAPMGIAANPSAFEIDDLQPLWRGLTQTLTASASPVYREMQFSQRPVWNRIRAYLAQGATVELDGKPYRPAIPTTAERFAADLQRVPGVSSHPVALGWEGDYQNILHFDGKQMHLVNVAADGTTTEVPLPATQVSPRADTPQPPVLDVKKISPENLVLAMARAIPGSDSASDRAIYIGAETRGPMISLHSNGKTMWCDVEAKACSATRPR